jgi:hypothetical protein
MRGRTFETLDTIGQRFALRKGAAMTDRLTLAPPKELPSPEVLSSVLLGGNLRDLSPKQQVSFYGSMCDSLGLNPLTKPFEFITLSGKLVLYATRNATDQLRKIYGISVVITAREVIEDTYVVTARATLPSGRADESIGAVPIAGLKGEARSNAMMKAETKSKRRVTLSLVGLSTLDESEVDSIPNAVKIDLPKSALSAGVLDSQPGKGEVPAASADLNSPIPDTWKPFASEKLTGVIVAIETETLPGKKSGRTYTKSTAVLDSGESAATLDAGTATQAQAFKTAGDRVVITVRPHDKLGKEIVGIALDEAF